MTVRTTVDLNLRTGPGIAYDVILTIPKDAAVSLDGAVRSGWQPILYNGRDGYVFAKYLTGTPDPEEPPMPTNPAEDNARASLLSFLHIPYIWGGQTRAGLDCSGLVGEWWADIGFVPPSYDTTADKLFDGYRAGSLAGTKLDAGRFGALAFFGSGTYAGHVAVCYDEWALIGANGGSKTTNTAAEARARGACVRMDRIGYRDDLLGIWLPAYPWVS